MWTTRSPGVSRSRMSRGTTRRIALDRRTLTEPNSSRSGTTARPSGPPSNPPVEAPVDECDRAAWWRLRHARHDADGVPGLAEQLREAGGLVADEDDPRLLAEPVLNTVDEALRPAGREDGLTPAEQVARREALRGVGHALGVDGIRLPGQLQRARAVEPALPVDRREVRGRPFTRQITRLDELAMALI